MKTKSTKRKRTGTRVAAVAAGSVKSYTITIEEKDGMQHMKRVNDGFTALELLGLTTRIQLEIIYQIKGMMPPPDKVTRQQVVSPNAEVR
jgi:hypothetical protein